MRCRVAPPVLTNTHQDLRAVLEYGQFSGACDRYFADPDNASDYLTQMCGKWMFFYEGFDLLGVPKSIVSFMTQNLPDTVGEGFEHFGLIPDPYSEHDLPLGFPDGKVMGLGVPTVAFGCASCHFGRTRDGRYSIGQPNHQYEYGAQVLAMMYFPLMAVMPESMTDAFISDVVQERLAPLVAEFNQSDQRAQLMLSLLPLASLLQDASAMFLSIEQQEQYASWKSGVQDFLIDPVGLDDDVAVVSKILSLWELPTPDEVQAHGSPHGAMLGTFGVTHSLDNFLAAFVALSLGDEDTFDFERVRPLYEFIYTLRTPINPNPPEVSLAEEGERLFESQGCVECHNGPRHSGTRVYTFDKVGTSCWCTPRKCIAHDAL